MVFSLVSHGRENKQYFSLILTDQGVSTNRESNWNVLGPKYMYGRNCLN